MSYIVRQAHVSGGGFAGCFGKPASHQSCQAQLVCPLCAHETGDVTTKTARISTAKYIECDTCGRFTAVMAENGANLVPGVVAFEFLTGLASMPAVRHALVLDGHGAEGVGPLATGDYADLKAALLGDGQLLVLTQVDTTSPGPTVAHARFPVVRLGDAARLLSTLRCTSDERQEPQRVPDALARLMEAV